MKKIAIVGSRNFKNYYVFKRVVSLILDFNNLTKKQIEIISGGAEGADSLARRYAIENSIPFKELLADWKKFGKKAGYIRNVEIWNYSDFGIAFWDGVSKGTSHSIDLAEKQGKKLFLYYAPENKIYLLLKKEHFEMFKKKFL